MCFSDRYVSLKGCYRITVEAVQSLCSSLSSLKVLDVRGCKLFTSPNTVTDQQQLLQQVLALQRENIKIIY